MVQINHDYYEDLTPENFEKLLDDLAAGRPVKPGPQSGRHTSEPHGDVKTLTDPALYDGSMVGAWRKRFEEEAVKAVDTGEAATATATAASNPKPAKPDAGRALGTEAADTPAKRAKEGEIPVSATERKESADASKTTTLKQESSDKVPAAQSDKSYVATPSKPEAGRTTADSPTTPVAGTPPSDASTRRDGTESKPDVVLDHEKKSS
jgi:NADH-quinone oxidoreductase subunit E